ncbi:MAG: DEAD/DEAH box helicase [bacterium]
MNSSFKAIGISDKLIKSLASQSITLPTEIQKKAMPELLKGADIVGLSETGSGKTLAYLLPLLMKIDAGKLANQALIVAPTHELAIQIFREIEKLVAATELDISFAQCIGGANINRQIEKLKKKPHIIVGSVGRVYELISSKKIDREVKTLIVDEADKMLDDNNFNSLLTLVKSLKKSERQTLFFSASIDEKTLNRAKMISKDLLFIKTVEKTKVNPNIEHFFITCEKRDKILFLRKFYAAFKGKKGLIFANNDLVVSDIYEKLAFHKLQVSSLHGRFGKLERKSALEDFRKGKKRFLISSDISARGLDIKKVEFVINFDMPQESLDYLHRAGRGARAQAKGWTVSLVTSQELKLLKRHSRHYNFNLIEAFFKEGIFLIKQDKGEGGE